MEDPAGNIVSTPTKFISDETVNGSRVSIDVEKPDIGNVLIVSSNPNSGFAKAGDNLTLSFTTSEVVRNPLEYLNIQGVDLIDLSTSDVKPTGLQRHKYETMLVLFLESGST